MSGRDYKLFVNTHRDRTSTADNVSKNLVVRVQHGIRSNMYKEVDYEKLRALAAEKKFAANESLVRVKKIEQASKQTKEQNTVKQHKKVWQKEFMRLNGLRRRQQVELEAHIRQNTDFEAPEPELYEMFQEYESSLANDFTQFKKDTVDPIWTLREDLQYWVMEHQNGPKEEASEHTDILHTIESVKAQQEQITQRLYNEQLSLEGELQTADLCAILAPHERRVDEGIPEEAFCLECPDDELKSQVLKEFILLDEKHRDILEDMEMKHSDALSVENGGWTAEEHFTFTAVQEQYSYDIPNRRTLFLDRLKRHLPHKTRQQVVEHESWCLHHKYYHERRKDIINDWIRDRRELFNKARAIFAEVCQAQELQEAKAEFKKQQRALCDVLYDKVKVWREQKMEAMMIQQKLEESRRAQEEEKRRTEEEKEKKRRAQTKDKIKSHHDELEKQKLVEEEKIRKRLEDLQKIFEEQAAYDRERVRFRDQQQEKKLAEKLQLEEERQREEEEKEQRLEALRQQVRVVAESDPERLLGDTEASNAKKAGDDDITIQQPLFQVNTFTANQVVSDPRVKLESKLREAGVHNTDYARHMMSQMKPLHPPRRDMESTVFKQ